MTLVQVDSISKYIAGQPIFSNVSVSIEKNSRVGVVGQNGEGKTTLLQLIAGTLIPDEGEVAYNGNQDVGMMQQDAEFASGTRVIDVALEPFTELFEIEEELRELERKISSEDEPGKRDRLLKRYGSLQTSFEDLGGYGAEARAREALLGLGFSESEMKRETDRLSGGERVRLALARLLLTEPDILLLDEPTNHLDFAAAEWLEEFLANYDGSVVAVSHDRYFIDRLVDDIWEVHRGRVECYQGNYSDYLDKREERRKQWQDEYEQQQKEIARLKSFVRRYRAGQRSKEAQSRQKRLDRMQRIPRPPSYDGGLNLSFPVERHSGREVLHTNNLTVCKKHLLICNNVDLRVFRGERIALMGPNGSGKTTFLKSLMGLEDDVSGDVEWGDGVNIAHFPQDLSSLDHNHTVLEEFYKTHPDLGMSGAREYLAKFGFSGDDVFTRVNSLSGGEQSRLVLAEIAQEKASVLLLDEPTNHLDLESLKDLETALDEYEGTVIFVSHDRYFIDQVATKIWMLADGKLEEFFGNYTKYREEQKTKAEDRPPQRQRKKQKQSNSSSRKQKSKSSRPTTDDLQSVEDEIVCLEDKHEELSDLLVDPESYSQGEGGDLVNEFRSVQKKLEELYRRWEELATLLEESE